LRHVYVENIGAYVGQEVEIKGWVYNHRSSGKIQFLLIRDGTGIIQGVVIDNLVSADVFSLAAGLTQESSVVVRGEVKADKRAPGGYELTVADIELVQRAEDYPITPKEHGVDFLLDHRHLWIRSPRQHAILRIRSEVVKACRDFLDDRGFTLVDAPLLTPAACEGTTTLFETDYFGEKAFLTQSGQLYMEAAAMALGKVYCFGPTFRAEKSKTRRHLMEFWMVEPEVAYADNEDNVRLEEQFVSYLVGRVMERRQEELSILERDMAKLENISAPFPRLSYDDAVKMLQKHGVEFTWGDDLGGGDETVISKQFDKPVFITNYPAGTKAFYMKPDPGRPEVVLCADLLAPEGYGEIIGGGQRIDDLDFLRQRMDEQELPAQAYAWYHDLRRYGSVPHSGFGMGIERFLAWVCGLQHVRETIPFPRLLNRMYP